MLGKIKELAGKIFLVRRSRITAIALAVVVVVMFGAIYSPAIVGAAATERLLPIYSVKRDGKMVSLTFDAAWGNVRLGQ